ncbi:MAG TPA: pyroglutamyl-peptidase I [Anaerolineaceae bacterium]
MRILITGFEPFGDTQVNPSEELVHSLADEIIPDVDLTRLVLPVDTKTAPVILQQTIRNNTFQAIVCLGEASGNTSITLERVSINLLDFRIPDNSGIQVIDQPINPEGPAAYFSTLPIRKIEQTLRKHGIPVCLSCSAGTYLCNQIMYTLLEELAINQISIPAGFIHLPALPAKAAAQTRPIPTMSLETMRMGIKLILQLLSEASN